ncbi:hypothetical protein [Rhodopila sp.]|uniref:hypothetical protein n=1 Tax=Rhodopila sp. TaxID=2480087 RepID=UPI003D0FBC24
MRIRSIPVLVAVMAALSVTTLAAGMVTVSQQNRAFTVDRLQLARGDTIRFSNDDKFRHQIYVESPSFTFESDEQAPGTAVDITFPQAGLFQVRCHIHPKMLLQVEVH